MDTESISVSTRGEFLQGALEDNVVGDTVSIEGMKMFEG